MAKKNKREYVRVPVILHGTVRVPVPEGFTAREVEEWIARQGGTWDINAESAKDVEHFANAVALNFFTDAVTESISQQREASVEKVLS